MTQIDTIARRFGQMRMKDQVDIAVIDYIGMIQGSKSNDKASSYTSVGDVVKAMQTMSRELEMPVITAAQLNREVYNNAGNKPELNNVADSSVISHCANVVHLLWRPDTDSKFVSGSNIGNWQDVVQMITAKVRDAADHKPMFFHINAGFAKFREVAPKMRQTLASEEEQRKIVGQR
jgi:replicative DNA helicase